MQRSPKIPTRTNLSSHSSHVMNNQIPEFCRYIAPVVSQKSPYVNVNFGSLVLPALIDSGSARSFISMKLFQQLLSLRLVKKRFAVDLNFSLGLSHFWFPTRWRLIAYLVPISLVKQL